MNAHPSDPRDAAPDAVGAHKFWPHVWWRFMEMRLGVIPVPVVIALLGVIAYFVHRGKLPTEVCMMIATLGVGGFLCGELGRRLPLLRSVSRSHRGTN